MALHPDGYVFSDQYNLNIPSRESLKDQLCQIIFKFAQQLLIRNFLRFSLSKHDKWEYVVAMFFDGSI